MAFHILEGRFDAGGYSVSLGVLTAAFPLVQQFLSVKDQLSGGVVQGSCRFLEGKMVLDMQIFQALHQFTHYFFQDFLGFGRRISVFFQKDFGVLEVCQQPVHIVLFQMAFPFLSPSHGVGKGAIWSVEKV